MSQQLLTESPEKTKQQIARREQSADSARSVHDGSPSPILQLHRALGNYRVAQLIQAKRLTPEGKILNLQRKLTVGAAGDQYEQEADRVARHVVSMPESVALAALQPTLPAKENAGHPHSLQSKPLPLAASITPFVQRTPHKANDGEEDKEQDKPGEVVQARRLSDPVCSPLQRQEASEKNEDEPVQAKRLDGTSLETLQRQAPAQEEDRDSIQAKSAASLAGSFDAGEDVEARLSQSKGGGSPLPDPVRAFMEPRFGVDFSHVRVHTGSHAVQMNRDVAAQAFTHGADIYYGAGSSPTNLDLTAHELTHVVQQTGGKPLQTKKQVQPVALGPEPSVQRTCAACAGGSTPCSTCVPDKPEVVQRRVSKSAGPLSSTLTSGSPVIIRRLRGGLPPQDQMISLRRPPVAATIQRNAPATSPSAARALQQGLGNHGAQLFTAQVVARSAAPGDPLGGRTSAGPFSLSHPDDAHEHEADAVAQAVMRMPQPGGGLAGGGAPAVGSPGRREAPQPSPSPAGARGGTAAEPRPTPGAAGGTTAPVAGRAASGAGSAPAVTAVDAVSGASGAAPAAGAAASETGAALATPLPAPIAALPNLTASTAPVMTSVAGVAVSMLGIQLSVKAYEKAPKGPMPTGLSTGPEPVLPQEPTIPEARDVTPGSDPESPGAIEAAAQWGATQLEGGRRAAEQAAAGDMGVGALAPTEQPDEIPDLGLKFVLPTGGPPPIDAMADPEVADLLERVHGKEGRETAVRELGPAQSMLADGEQMIDSQHTEAAELLRTENEQGTLQQVAAREEARMAVEQNKAKLRDENIKATGEYQREASSEKTTAEAEVRKAKEDARKAEEQDRNQPEEEGDEAWYEWAWSKVKSGAKAVASAVKDAVVAAYRFVKDRVKRFFSKIRELVNRGISKIREIGGRIYRAIRDKLKSALNKIKEIARRIGSFVKDLVKRVGSFISDIVGRIVGFFKDVIGRIADFWRKVWAFAVKVKELIKLIANGVIQVFVDLIENTRAVIAKVKGSIQEFINNTPAKMQEVYDEHIAPLLNGKRGPGGKDPEERSASADAGLGGVVARAFIQRQEAEHEEEVKETHSEGVWRHLKVRGNYFVDNWWGVVKDALFEILVPGVAIYRHAPVMWKKVVEAWGAFRAGKPSQGWDAVLDAARELWAMVGVFIAQVSIAAFIIGSILGTPIVGVAALEAIGIGVIAIDIALQAATIAKAVSNFDDADEDEKRLEADYGRVADSSIAIVIMLVLVALGAVAKVTATALLRRFPALGRIAEGLKAKVRGKLGMKPKRPPEIPSKFKPVEVTPPPSSHPTRALLPNDDARIAFDKWMEGKPPQAIKARVDGKTVPEVMDLIKKELKWVAEQKANMAHNALWEGEMLDPKMKNGPVSDPRGDVRTRWNDKPPKEVDEGLRLSKNTGERVDLFGDDFPGIDGTIGQPPRPLQLKAVPANVGVENIPRVAGDALEKALAKGFSRVEVSIEAPGRTVAEVKAAFEANPPGTMTPQGKVGPFIDPARTFNKGTSRVRVWCKDGVFEPTNFTPVPPPVHPDLGPDKPTDSERDKVPAGATSGG